MRSGAGVQVPPRSRVWQKAGCIFRMATEYARAFPRAAKGRDDAGLPLRDSTPLWQLALRPLRGEAQTIHIHLDETAIYFGAGEDETNVA